jgi:flavin-dependent dehydrogenase
MAVPAPPDYVVAGAGPAGMTIARLLALRGRRVVVASGGQRRNANRLELLAPAARRTVAALGLEPLILDRAIARPCLGIRRTHAKAEYEDFLGHPHREGHVVDRLRFDSCLRDAALAAGVEVVPLRVIGVASCGDALRVRTKSGAQDLLPVNGIVIDATGRTAAIARRKGASVAFRDRMVAELVEDTPAISSRHMADDAPSWLDFQPGASGWSYRIRGPGERVQTWRLCRAGDRSNNSIRCVDASAGILSRAAGNGWIAVGDAAMSFNPIASQGLFNALSSALSAAGLLLSEEGLSPQAADAWSCAVAATFLRSEVGRAGLNPVQSDS